LAEYFEALFVGTSMEPVGLEDAQRLNGHSNAARLAHTLRPGYNAVK
jgi:hypothetical protein